MAVEIDSERKAVNIKWDVEKVESDRVDIYAMNAETGDTSKRVDLPNDGYAVLTYPVDFSGSSKVAVVPAGTQLPEGGDISPGDEGEVSAEQVDALEAEGADTGSIQV